VFENLAPNTDIIIVAATDQRQSSSSILFTISSGNEDSLFSIDPALGTISLTGSLDFESNQVHSLIVTAFGFSSQSATATVLIFISDVNDNPPIFTQNIFTASVTENSPFGQTILQISATDGDISPANNQISFFISPPVPEFDINSTTGVITSQISFDFETVQSYSFVVLATDSGEPALSSSASVNIVILDVDDVRPQFTRPSISVGISELAAVGSSVAQVTAFDPDTRNITYFFLAGNEDGRFEVNPSSGLISLTRRLDFEARANYSLTIRASDGVDTIQPSNTAVVTIQVMDGNDNAPAFSQETYTVAVAEDTSLGSFILAISADDLDSGVNGRVVYSLANNTQDSMFFSIDQISGAIYLIMHFDYETQKLYEVIAFATDEGDPTLASQSLVQVAVLDVNDNPPIFSVDNFTVVLNEDAQNGSQIAQFIATDADSGSNAAVTYQFQGSDTIPFSINPVSGTIQVDGFLDYERQTSYQVIVVATDHGTIQMSSTVIFRVTVSDVNDNPPVFEQLLYLTSVPESASTGNLIITVRASDADSENNAALRYAIVAGNINQEFEINTFTGAITLASSLNFESIQSYTLSVRAGNDLASTFLAATTTVVIEVEDVNEFIPTFSMAQYMFRVEENEPEGMLVGRVEASDSDRGSSGQLLYEITSGNSGSAFLILDNGTIITSASLDREQQNIYQLTVVASDSGHPPLNGSVLVIVTIQDKNDIPPTFFFSSYSASVVENTVAGTDVVFSPPLMVSDRDDPNTPNAVIAYSISSGNQEGLFVINRETGLLQTAGLLDYETASSYILQLQASDSGIPPLSSFASVSITVLDTNDNPPFIYNVPSQLTFLEGQDSLLIASNVTVGDPDSLLLSSISVTLTSSNSNQNRAGSLSITSPSNTNLLSIMNDGRNLRLTGSFENNEATLLLRTLEYVNIEDEPEPSNRSVVITLADGQFQTTSQTQITIQLVNDNKPVLDLNSDSPGLENSAIFIEGGQAVAIAANPAVSDLDRSRIVSVEASLIDAQNGHLEGLSIESVPLQHNFEYRNGNHTLFVSFSMPSVFSVVEEVVSTIMYFNLANEPSPPLSRSILVTISDGEQSSNPVAAIVNIQLINDPPQIQLGPVTDNFVTFREGQGPVLLSENAVVLDSDNNILFNATVSLIEAPDNSSEMLTFNASVQPAIQATSTAHIIEIPGPATLEEFTEILRTVQYNNILQRPSSSMRTVRYIISDGELIAEAVTLVSFNLFNDPPFLDLNGPLPGVERISTYTEGSVPLQVASPDFVLNDIDSDDLSLAVINLSVRPDGELEGLSLRSTPSQLIVNAAPATIEVRGQAPVSVYASILAGVDYFNMAEEPTGGDRIVTMVVSDGESNSSVVMSTIQVQVVNDPPVLVLNNNTVFATAYIEEQLPVSLVDVRFNILVEDSDNDTFSYLSVMLNNIVDGNSDVLGYEDLSIDQSLSVASSQGLQPNSRLVRFQFSMSASTGANFRSLLASLTYRSTSREPTAGQREVTFQISDGLLNSQTQRTSVDIILVNDNVPVFQQFLYTARVRENLAGVPITTIVASDADASDGLYAGQGRLRYEIISGNDAGRFQINEVTGEISITAALNREEGTFNPALTVRASNLDPLEPGLGASFPMVFAIITVEDVNDNIPQFLNTPYTFELAEHAQVGTAIGNVTATDADVGRNSQIEYAITSGVPSGAVVIDANSGEIQVGISDMLDREVRETITFSVLARDGGTPQTSNSTLVVLNLIDVNDNAPMFSQSSYTQSISESAPVNSRVLAVSAQDADAGMNMQFSFSLNGSSAFTINSTSGEIYLAISLDREIEDSYTFQILAVDFGTPALSSSATVVITLEDENDNIPVFENVEYSVLLLENSPLQQPVDVVLATDNDAGSNGEVSYSIPDSSVPFSIDAQNGIITVSGLLDRELQGSYSFVVLARDNGTPQQTAQTTYNVTILDVNDNRPLFHQQSYFVMTLESLPPLSVITMVTATDRDIGTNAELTFLLMDPSQTFQINSSTGEIFLAGTLDFEMQTTYLVDLSVSDHGQPPLFMTTSLTVNVTDVNDNAPFFSQEQYQFRILENLAPHSVGFILAQDRDSGNNAVVQYSLTNASISSDGMLFTVDPDSGELFVTSPLDREATANYSFSVVAEDSGSLALSSSASVFVVVEDANDNAPMFTEMYASSVKENHPLGSVLLTVNTQDADEGSNAEVMYQIIMGNSLGLFDINSTSGSLFLVNQLDAETLLTHSVEVQATDSGAPSQFSTTTVIISVGNINDVSININIPSPAISYVEGIPPVPLLANATVSDGDIVSFVQNATVELIGDNHSCCDEIMLASHEVSGVTAHDNSSVFIQGPLSSSQLSYVLQSILFVNTDPEPLPHTVTARVSASDGIFADKAEVSVTITTINDNAPTVYLNNPNVNYTVIFTENGISLPIVNQAVITDQDSGTTMLQSLTVSLLEAPDGSLEALSVNSTGLVSAFPMSGHILRLSGPATIQDFVSSLSTLKYINMAENPQVPLLRVVEVVASDGMFESTPSFVSINVVSVNDPPYLRLASSNGFSPIFVENSNPVRLTAEGARLLDPDSPMLDSATVSIIDPINRGTEYILVSSSNPLTVVRISESEIMLLGPAPVANFLLAIQSVFYSNNASNPTMSNREVLFNVSDGSLAFSLFVTVQVQAVNNPPRVDLSGLEVAGNDFSNTFTEGGMPVTIASPDAFIDDTDNTTIVTLMVSIQQVLDGSHERLSISDLPESISQIFLEPSLELRGEGNLTLYSALLRRIVYVNTANEPSDTARLLQVVASDGLADNEPSTVTINFSFVNDAPEIALDSTIDFVTIYQENSSPIPISNVRSAGITDVDSGTLSYIELVVSNLLDGELEVVDFADPAGGLLEGVMAEQTERVYNLSYGRPMPLSVFNDILLSITYQNNATEPNNALPRIFVVTVNDGELTSLPATSTISIQLVDDNEPEFNSPLYIFNVSEDASVGTKLGFISAIDLDLGDTFLYQLGNTDIPFMVNRTSGDISTVASLDREINARYETVAFTTRPVPPFSVFDGQATVIINIIDINDNPPSFNQTSISLQVPENVEIGHLITTILAYDPDEGTNAVVIYNVTEDVPFAVEQLEGTLSTTQSLDREQTEQYQFTVTASDRRNPALSSSISVAVSILDINDNTPQFLQTSYSARLMENTQVGTSVTQVSAVDRDSGSNGLVTFSLNPTNSQFSLDQTSGVLTTLTSLTPGLYTFTAIAEDSGSPSLAFSIPLTIEVISFNSTLPVFTQSSYDGSIPENSPQGLSIVLVVATDPTGENHLIYNISSIQFSELFDIDSLTGIISTGTSSLDRESQDFYQLQVSASSADKVRMTVTQVNIRVLDENDFAPVFLQSMYTFTIAENNKIGAILGMVSATDSQDIGVNAQILNYTSSSPIFSISSSGVVTANEMFDREALSNYSFVASAIDSGNPALTGTALVSVVISDTNDQAPIFAQTRYEGRVEENSPIGTSVVMVEAIDGDLGSNGNIAYLTNSSLFSINILTGVLMTASEFDFESNLNGTLEVAVEASDGGSPVSLMSSVIVLVSIVDVDDVPPAFSRQTYFSSILEEELQTSFFQVLVTDSDSDLDQNFIAYSITGGNEDEIFSIDSSGSLSVVQAADRELVSQYVLTIHASNLDSQGATLSSLASVVVEVLDLNDNPPVFLGQPYSFSVLEGSASGTVLGTLSASDIDSPRNGNISGFAISSGDPGNQFQIGSTSGVLQVSETGVPLDRENLSQYTLTVTVSDNGSPPQLASSNVSISVLDVNDNEPVFNQSEYSISITENTLVETTIFSARGEVSDVDLGSNSALSFSIVGAVPEFVLSSDGLLTVASQLDFESQMLYLLTIQAVDGGSPQLTGTSQLTINILDQDDLPLQFSSSTFNASVPENVTVGSTVLSILAVDPDTVQGSPITYSIQPISIPFTIDLQSGNISLVAPLDRESVSFYSFPVLASNTPGFTSTATVYVQVLDINDNMPQFDDGPFQFTVSELEPVGFVFGQVSAIDVDDGAGGAILSYTLENNPTVIAIDPTNGTLAVVENLDFELRSSYTFDVLATDAGNPSLIGRSSVVVNVIDANDNSPQFSADQYEAIALENTTIGFTIFTAQAQDADSGTNGAIMYSLEQPISNFAINSATGVVTSTSVLTVQTYSIRIVALDGGSPTLNSSTTLNVQVLDVNESPVFAQDLYATVIPEDRAVNSLVVQVFATDPDSGTNADITYRIAMQDLFAIDAQSGRVTLVRALDFEMQDAYSVSIFAMDGGNPPLSVMATLMVNVTDTNDNAPIFLEDPYQVAVTENTTIGTSILTVQAVDADSTSNGILTYRILQDFSSGSVSVDPLSGVLTTIRDLDYETAREIRVAIEARDGGTPFRTSTAMVIIFITDVDDNPPVFNRSMYTSSTMEDLNVGQTVLQVFATDLDSGTNADILYALVNSENSPFTIVSQTGAILLSNPGLDREQVDQYTFSVEAVNPSSPLFRASASVLVNVLDSNDNRPLFDPDTLVISASESLPVDTTIGRVIATDNDIGSNAFISYRFDPPSPLVSIGTASGEIHLTSMLDFETAPTIDLTVVVTDSGLPPLTNAANLRIIVGNTNDEASVLGTTSAQFTYQEGSSSIAIGSGITLSDPDMLPLASGTVQLFYGALNVPPPGTDFIQVNLPQGALGQVQVNATSSSIRFTGSGSLSTYTALLSSLQFGSTASEPETVPRLIVLQVYDGIFTSNSVTIMVSVALVNDNDPILDLSTSSIGLGYSTTFTEGGLPVFLVGSDLKLSDADSDLLQSINVTLTNAIDAEERLNTNPLVGILILNVGRNIQLVGPATAVEFEAALQFLTYENSASEPSDSQQPRLVEFIASDGERVSEPAIATVSIQTVNDPPSILLGRDSLDTILTYVETDEFLPLVSNDVQISDLDNAEIAFVNVTIMNYMQGTDLLHFSTEDQNITSELLSGTLLLTGPAVPSSFELVLQTLQYVNLNIEMIAMQGQKSVHFTVNDGSLNSMVATAFIPFSAINDPPIIDLNGPLSGLDYTTTFVEDEGRVAAVSQNLTITDVDSPLLQFVTVTLQEIVDPLNEILATNLSIPEISSMYNLSTGVLLLQGPSVTSNFEYVLRSLTYADISLEPIPGVRRIFFSASDGNDTNLPVMTTVSIVITNDAPEIVVTESAVTFTEDRGPVKLIGTAKAQITDTDSPMLTELEVNLRNAPDGTLENIFVSTSIPNLIVSRQMHGNTSTFVFSFPNTFGTLEKFAAVIGNLSYNNSAMEPSPVMRFVDIVVFDESLRSNLVTIPITVQLINDNPPQFGVQDAEVTIAENAPRLTPIYAANAVDVDENSTILYAIYPMLTPFEIDPASGVILLLGSLDREIQDIYTLNVTAFDGVNTGLLVLRVVVTDVNDNGPVFDMNPVITTVNENVPVGTSVIQVEATDADLGLNGRLTYSITEGNPQRLFAINSTTGEIVTSNAIDYEMSPLHTLSVQAEDSGSPTRQTNMTFVLISILDLNDNVPVFAVDQDYETFSEDTPVSSLLYTVQATDADADTQLVYSLVNGSRNLFFVGRETGQIILTGSLDFEMAPMHQIAIETFDGQHAAIFQLDIIVTDVNDNPPVFVQDEFRVSVAENATVGTDILQGELLRVTDTDSGTNAEVQFFLETGDPNNQFALNQLSSNAAQLILARVIDREVTGSYDIIIIAQNPSNTNQNDSALVLVTVSDTNDNAPVFTAAEYNFTAAENSSIGTTVGRVVTTDADEGTNAVVQYMLLPDNTETFSMTAEGYIVTTANLDYEAATLYSLTVEAVDLGIPPMSARAVINIFVQDLNDNVPNFIQNITVVFIEENVPVPTLVAVLQANDSDSSSNGDIVYSIHSSSSNDFSIDPQSGSLTTARLFDFEADSSQLLVTVIAADGGIPPLSSEAFVVVNLQDVNEFAPQFTLNDTELSVREDTGSSTIVADLQAVDNDSGSAGVVEYKIISPSSLPFAINNNTGEIFLNSGLDREQTQRYEVTVEVFNPLVSPTLPSRLNLVFVVEDVNDNPPMFTRTELFVTITTSANVGDTVLVVTAVDADSGSNADIRYYLLNFVEEFTVTTVAGNGIITLVASFNGTTASQFNLTIEARDLGQPPLFTTATLVVGVIQPLLVDFALQGAGFLLDSNSPTTQDFGFFVNSPAGSEGVVSATLGRVSANSTYNTSLLEAVSVRGVVLNEEVWHDIPEVTVMVQVADATGDSHCLPTEVVITVVPDAALRALANVNQQVSLLCFFLFCFVFNFHISSIVGLGYFYSQC